ncbi:hypothetical protein [Reichenbachiella ulvae]|uniref:Receptor L-domain domain-containing protein n=1 Tax=Reichenbachiella ulvae TaxID=2980104 RepID=A0ABT3CP47_9BACT|nr:hypothetical protein [Reichenbachiella ulvae]MCV9385230.1 hypothetical protein [Reichenbachiella ulvae]
MRKKLLTVLAMSSIYLLSGCVGDEIDDMQKQIDTLEEKVTDLEASQQEALLAAIAALETSIAELEATGSEQYTALLENLATMEEEIQSNASAIYYGNLLTQEDYDAMTAQGASIVTGKVIASKSAHITALADIKLIGGELVLTVSESASLPMLENVGENLVITGSTGDAAIEFGALTSVGGSFEVIDNAGLATLTADALVLVNDELHTENNSALTSLSFANLDMVEEVYINEYWSEDPRGVGISGISSIDLSYVNVVGDANIMYVGGGSLTLGNIGGGFKSIYNELTSIEITSESIGGDFIVEYNGVLENLLVDGIKTINGNLSVSFNDNGYYWDATEKTGLVTMPAFEALEYVGGDFKIDTNNQLTSMESFNAVTEIQGTNISISSNSTGMDLVNVLNALTTTGPNQYSNANIFIFQQTNWFDGFAALTIAADVSITINKPTDGGGGIGIGFRTTATTDVAKLEGFDALTEVKTLSINATELTEFNAFGALNNFLNYQTYLSLYMPSDSNVSMCSMEPILAKIKNGDFDVSWSTDRKAYFSFNWSEVDRDTAYDQLTAGCTL